MYLLERYSNTPEPWHKGRLVGQKPPLRIREIWAIRIRVQIPQRIRDLALFNLAIDSKLRGCDFVNLRVRDVANASRMAKRTMILQQKIQQPVQFEITEQTRATVRAWIDKARRTGPDYLFPSRIR